ncbi:MAG: serine/threonine protein kinase [Paenibacillaceae bacterium]|jgi:hypothetical protein|nr:serine/threonine protein kinase [Paenibacillaceae bacterium]
MSFQSYESYGIDRVWVERLKKKAKEPYRKERLKELAEGLTREDLQDEDLVTELVSRGLKVLGEKATPRQKEQLVAFVVEQRIDPDNMMHLFRLWNMFR